MTDDVAATRRAYDDGAGRYVEGIGTAIGPATETAHDQAVLSAFADAVAPVGRVVADLGCGPGRAAAFLRASHRRLEVVGVDLALALLRAGQQAHPSVPFVQGVLAALPLRTASLGGVVSWYSIIHTSPIGLASVAGELARVVVPGGSALVAFQAAGGEALEREAPTFRHAPDAVVDALAATGRLVVVERTVRPPELAHETAPQAFLLVRRAG